MTLSSSPLDVREKVPLAPFTTFGIGGPARFFAEATSERHVIEALEFTHKKNCPLFVLGGGSNLLVSDQGYDGLVLHIALSGIRTENTSRNHVITAAAGEPWDAFVLRCIEQNLAGVECLSGIPGTVGGTPVQNVGAYGEESSDIIVSVRVLERESGRIEEFSSARCGFAYRTSIFNSTHREQYILLAVTYALRAGGKPRFTHVDLRNRFSGRSEAPSLQEVRETVLAIRADKGMLVSPHDPDSLSAGSFFKNPIVGEEDASRMEESAHRSNQLKDGETLPQFKIGMGSVKLPAAWLIERSGFCKGFARGSVGLSTKHILALVNRGGAKAQDVVALMSEIQAGVRASFGIDLRPEPVFVGFDEMPSESHEKSEAGRRRSEYP